MPRRSSRRSSSQYDDDDEEEEVVVDDKSAIMEDDDGMFSSQVPELSQSIPCAKTSERNNLNNLSETAREKAIRDLTRLVLFKGLTGEPIDRPKCVKEAGLPSDTRITSAAFEAVNERLQAAFDFELRRMPVWMQEMKDIPNKYKDRYYLVNNCLADNTGSHSKALHAVHELQSIEKGFLMLVLALCYCKGEPRVDGSRWILDRDLYHLLHKTDEHIPAEPPLERNKKRRISQSQRGSSGVALTPDVDALLHLFVQRDYLMQRKAVDLEWSEQGGELDEQAMCYALGPRSAMEVGRKQIVVFCAEILDQEPDPTMMMEFTADEEAAEELMQEGEN